jgi:hypothetical protein
MSKLDELKAAVKVALEKQHAYETCDCRACIAGDGTCERALVAQYHDSRVTSAAEAHLAELDAALKSCSCGQGRVCESQGRR